MLQKNYERNFDYFLGEIKVKNKYLIFHSKMFH